MEGKERVSDWAIIRLTPIEPAHRVASKTKMSKSEQSCFELISIQTHWPYRRGDLSRRRLAVLPTANIALDESNKRIQPIVGLSQRFVGSLLGLDQLSNLSCGRASELSHKIHDRHECAFDAGHPSFGLNLSLFQFLDIRSELSLLANNEFNISLHLFAIHIGLRCYSLAASRCSNSTRSSIWWRSVRKLLMFT